MDISIVEVILSNPIAGIILVGIARSLLGWLENSVAAGKFQRLDVKKLLETIVRVSPQSASLAAVGVPPILGLLTDIGIMAVKKKKV